MYYVYKEFCWYYGFVPFCLLIQYFMLIYLLLCVGKSLHLMVVLHSRKRVAVYLPFTSFLQNTSTACLETIGLR